MNKYIVIILALILPHCGFKHKKQLIAPVHTQINQRIHQDAIWHDTIAISDAMHDTLSLEEAIAYALEHNPTIQSHFEELGIAESDLIQAGLYHNPHIESVFKLPRNKGDKTNIELTASLSISDLWQVPLKKKIAQDDLHIQTQTIISEILLLRKQVMDAYYACVYYQEQSTITKEIESYITYLKERIDYRYQFGLATDLDCYYASTMLGEWRNKSREALRMIQESFFALYRIMGIQMRTHHSILKTNIHISPMQESVSSIIANTQDTHPLILMQHIKMAQAQHQLSYEKSRILENVHAGFSYEQDFERSKGIGPFLSIDLPVFNMNQGARKRAEYQYRLHEKALRAQQQEINQHIATHYNNYTSYIAQLTEYEENILPASKNAILFSKDFFERMQLPMITYIDTLLQFFNAQRNYIALKYNAIKEYAELEYAKGGSFSTE